MQRPMPPRSDVQLDLKRKSREWKHQIVSVNRHEFRKWFGVRSADKWGSFVDCNLSAIVHSYADWAGYPRGKHTVLEGRDTEELTAVVISSDGYHLFTAMNTCYIRVWDLTENREIEQWKAHSKFAICLDYHRSGVLVSGGGDRCVKIWHGYTAALIHNLEGHTDWIDTVAFSEDGDRVVSGSDDNSIRIWSIETGECLRQFLGHLESVTNVRWIGDVILSISHDGSLKLWKLSDSAASKSVGNEDDDSMDDISVNCDHSLVCLIRGTEPIVYSWPNMKKICSIDTDSFLCCFHPCNPHLIALNTDDEDSEEDENQELMQIYDVRNRECVLTLESRLRSVIDFCFTPDGTRLISTFYPSTLHIWDVSSLLFS